MRSWVVAQPLDWRDEAACRGLDTDMFFSDESEDGLRLRVEARRVCMSCGVRERCLREALESGVRFGMWGGLTGRERARLRVAV